jgi:predicted cupin superfamily sugar epimerase
MDFETVKKHLGLIPLPEEGGFYKETYRSSTMVDVVYDGQKVERTAGTCIYYMMTPDEFSALHKVKGHEIFHFYMGDPVEMFQIDEHGSRKIIMGQDIFHGQQLQVHVPPSMWQGTKLLPGGKWALVGTNVFPGYEHKDFELADRNKFLQMYPDLHDAILDYTRV